MPSRIIRGSDTSSARINNVVDAGSGLVPQDHIMAVEKNAFEQGYREGERIGKQMGERAIEAVIKRYDRSILGFAAAQRDLAACMEQEAARLGMEIAKKIVRREVSADPDLVVALASMAVKKAVSQSGAVLRVSVGDAERIRLSMHDLRSSITVREDPSLERGDFVLDTAQSHFDGRIDAQVESLGRLFLES